jgi:signal transduction histidine kinase/PAS domain-containing protein
MPRSPGGSLPPALDQAPEPGFEIVALVTSAGGLQALSAVLRELPAGFPAPLVVVQHLGAGGSSMVEILRRRTALAVDWASDGAVLAAGQVLLCPALSTMEVNPDGTCSVQPGATTRDRPIDILLASLAQSHGERALGVVLTGMGRDCARGVQALKRAGGTVIAQSAETADQPAMPLAAIATGAVDLVLPLPDIGPLLVRVVAEGDRLPRPHSEAGAAELVFGGGGSGGGEGEMSVLLGHIDWSLTPLGPVAKWPQSLRTTVRNTLASHFPMCVHWGPQHVQLYNDAFAAILGSKHPEAAGRPASLTWAEVWGYVGAQFERVWRTGKAVYAEDVLLHTGTRGQLEESYYRFSYSPVRDERGVLQGLLHTVTDTTDRVLGERRLRTLRELATRAGGAGSAHEAGERAVEVLGDNPHDVPFALFYLLDPAQRRAHLAAAAGLTPGGVAAPHTVDLTSGAPGWPLAHVAHEGAALVVDDVAHRFRGLAAGPWPEAPKSALLLPLRVAEGRPAAVLVLGVSARRLLDQPYRDFLDLVGAQAAASLIHALSRQKEREKSEALGELDRARSEFFSNVSHELRSPLALLLDALEGAARSLDALPAPLAAEIATAERNARRLLGLADTLLDFARAETRELAACFEPVDLAAVTAGLAELFRPAAEQAGLGLAVDCPPLSEPVWVDREMWEKIVAHLLSNALKFTFTGEVAVALRALPRHAELTVRDTGGGIPAAELPHLFERFHRVHGAAARTTEGIGIGLALVHELVRLHQGRIRVKSVPGQGTTFTVWLTLGAREGGEARAEGAEPQGPAPVRPPSEVAVALAEAALGWDR